ncbi:hypothetical protein BGZ61DRAFT_101364 [Ilyonectria robusta]|uniref:uncharacterized protein n=1 Tax=Ilyonectria robusta TaxID=1079257 RepID=UPI001E8D9880|nr:uncharacterized protein BGZ61DRAFT_101364 [Ilyonectria robusta]KAH8672938.1 hypothetical protein BGZ61DRAFT_101364 [Ilyonectria robusta]
MFCFSGVRPKWRGDGVPFNQVSCSRETTANIDVTHHRSLESFATDTTVRCPLSRSSRGRIPPVFPSAQTFFPLFVSCPPVSLRLEVRSPSRGPSALWGAVILAATFRVAQHKRHDPGFWGQPGQEEVKSEHVCVRPPAAAISFPSDLCKGSIAAAQSTSPSVPTL